MKSNKKKILIMACIMLGIYAVNTLAVIPIYSSLATNVEYMNSPIADIFFYISNYLPFIASFIGLGFIIYAVETYSFKEATPYFVVYQISVLFSFAVSFILDLIESSGLEDELVGMLLYILINYVVEILIMYAVAFISVLAKKKASRPFAVAVGFSDLLVFVKDLIIELSYIIPFIAEYGISDIRQNEWISMAIQIISVFIVFVVGHFILRVTVSKLEKSSK